MEDNWMSSENALYYKRVDLGSDVISFTLSCYQIIWRCPWHERLQPLESFTEKHARTVAKLILEFGEHVWDIIESLGFFSVKLRVAAVIKMLLKHYGYGPYTDKRYMALCTGFAILLVFTLRKQCFSLFWKLVHYVYFYIYNPPWYWRSVSMY